jgi:isopentenyl-diphosphate delta-isomerase
MTVNYSTEAGLTLVYNFNSLSVKITEMNKTLVDYSRVNLVNDQDEIIASADKFEAHSGEAMLHQAISLFLFRKSKVGRFQLLIQKRSDKKIVGASQWANTVCGNVAMGESHRECVLRRLKEELGISLSKNLCQSVKEIFILNYQVLCNQRYSEKEIDHVFALFLNDQEAKSLELDKNPQEVADLLWIDWYKLIDQKRLEDGELTPWFKLFLDNEQLEKTINRFLENVTI